ncbi:MAG TPA: NAD(P)/FAD-dependent oxidoreductase [Kineosporiaceae bacterium]|nr:NAD(P)/FAD-dependent oxidoreductase [Kineosporiaceae bacterium]
MRVGIIGAGFAGLGAAKVLTEFGHDVTVFDRTPDVGGVWSRTRRYPGLTTQNDKGTYAYSDFPMPREYPQWPTGAQVQAYLESYVERFALRPLLRLDTEVTRALQDPATGSWTVQTASGEDADSHHFDFLVVANGTLCDPLIPDYPGVEEYRAGGGRLCHTSEFTELAEADARDIIVVGYGKSACDLAVAVSEVAASTTVVARNLIWKMPRQLGNLLNYKYLLLTRMGEALFPYMMAAGFERFLHAKSSKVPISMVGSIQSIVTRQLGLRESGLVPDGPFTDIARSTVSLVTEEFHPRIADGRITVHRDTEISRLLVQTGRPSAQLASGEIVPADLVICGTGFQQRVPFLSEDARAQLFDEHGNFELYHQILPLTVPKLAFVGYNSSFFSPLGAEVGALWLADYLGGAMTLPPVEFRRAQVQERLLWTDERTEGKHSRGTNVIPFSMHQIDEMLSDVGLDVGRVARIKQWLLPVDPSAYQAVAGQLHRRYGTVHAAAAAVRGAGPAEAAPAAESAAAGHG